MANNTGNPIGSTAAKDLSDNAENLDKFANGEDYEYADRLGRSRKSLRWIEDAALAIPAIDAAVRSEQQAELALSAKSDAEAARDAAQLSSGVYIDVATGLASTSSGKFFSVPSPEATEYLILYHNVDNAAVEIDRYPNAMVIESKVPRIIVDNQMVPFAVDDEDKVPAWFDKGKFDAVGVGPQILADLGLMPVELDDVSRVPLWSDDGEKVAIWLDKGMLDALGLGPVIRKALGLEVFHPYDPSRVPLWSDDGDKVAIWLDQGMFDAMGFGPNLTAAIEAIVKASIAAQPVDLNKLLTTTGKSLWLYKAKCALLKNGASAKLKVMFAGDSWSDLDTIPNKMGELLAQDYARSGYGWISALLNRMTNGVTASRTGWTLYDASSTPLAPEYGCAFDGGSITTNLSNATVKISNLTATKIVIYYRGGPGVFRYRVDGGTWATAPSGVLGAREKIVVEGLPDAAHELQIDTTGNASTVTLYGFYATRDVSGFEVLKCGRGGLRGGYAVKMLPYIADYAADLEADLLIISLGTNDYRAGDVQGYIDGLTGMIAKHREGRPDVGIIIIAPPDSNGVAVEPLTTFRDLGQHIARATGCEFADIHSIFPLFAKSNGLGLWMDDLHLNVYGAEILCRHIYNYLLK